MLDQNVDIKNETKNVINPDLDNSYQCTMCHKKLSSKENLHDHILIHSGQRPYKCGFINCKKTFVSEKRRLIHCQTHVDIPLFACETCGKSFKQKGNLKTHTRVHTGEKPFKCKHCEKAFKTRGQTQDHEDSHLGIKRFKCGECGGLFSRRFTLFRHKKLHLKNDEDLSLNKKNPHQLCSKNLENFYFA